MIKENVKSNQEWLQGLENEDYAAALLSIGSLFNMSETLTHEEWERKHKAVCNWLKADHGYRITSTSEVKNAEQGR